jgi:protein TonB
MARQGAAAAIALLAVAVAYSWAWARPRPVCLAGQPPDWAQRPDAGAWSDFYPAAAGLPPGRVILSCVAGADGRLYECEVVEETPANQGLGLWALHVSLDFRLKRPGCPPNGARFSIPLSFVRSD